MILNTKKNYSNFNRLKPNSRKLNLLNLEKTITKTIITKMNILKNRKTVKIRICLKIISMTLILAKIITINMKKMRTATKMMKNR